MTDRQYLLAYSEYVPLIKAGLTYKKIKIKYPDIGRSQFGRLRRILGLAQCRQKSITKKKEGGSLCSSHNA